MPAEGRENPLLKKGNSDAFFREKYLTKNIFITDVKLPAYFLKAVSYLYISERPIYALIAYLPIPIPHTLAAGE